MPSDSNRETRMPPLRQILAVLALGASLASQTAVAAECPYPGKVVFAGLNWESGMFTTDLLRYVLEKGYGCETDALPGNTVTMENALRQNDIQVTGEQWAGRSPVWRAAEEAGEVFSVGETVKGATEGWWVPEYLVKGDPQRGIEAKAPELRSVADLPRYKALFRDPEEPAKGRFYNCRPAGPARSSTARSSRPTGCRTATRTSAPAPARRWMRRSVRPSGAVSRCFSTIGRRLR